eukprot:1385788-Rhodomonas_salina.1
MALMNVLLETGEPWCVDGSVGSGKIGNSHAETPIFSNVVSETKLRPHTRVPVFALNRPYSGRKLN